MKRPPINVGEPNDDPFWEWNESITVRRLHGSSERIAIDLSQEDGVCAVAGPQGWQLLQLGSLMHPAAAATCKAMPLPFRGLPGRLVPQVLEWNFAIDPRDARALTLWMVLSLRPTTHPVHLALIDPKLPSLRASLAAVELVCGLRQLWEPNDRFRMHAMHECGYQNTLRGDAFPMYRRSASVSAGWRRHVQEVPRPCLIPVSGPSSLFDLVSSVE